MLQAARKEKLAGATVLQGIGGAGYHETKTPSLLSVVRHLPIIVEIVDGAEKIAAFVKGPLDQIMLNGMLTLAKADRGDSFNRR